MDGFAYAGEALVGKEIGAYKREGESGGKRVSIVVKLLFVWSLGVGLAATCVFALTADGCYSMMTSDRAVIEMLQAFTPWLIAMPIVSTLAFMWDGVYAGATAGVAIRNAMLWAAVGFVAGYAITASWLGVHALFVSYFLHLIARVGYLTLAWKPIARMYNN